METRKRLRLERQVGHGNTVLDEVAGRELGPAAAGKHNFEQMSGLQTETARLSWSPSTAPLGTPGVCGDGELIRTDLIPLRRHRRTGRSYPEQH